MRMMTDADGDDDDDCFLQASSLFYSMPCNRSMTILLGTSFMFLRVALLPSTADTLETMEDHPIHFAADRGDLGAVQRFITEQPALMDRRDHDNRTPLLRAAYGGHAEMMEWLLDQGADPEAHDVYRWHALYIASHQGHTALVSILLDRGFDINRRANHGMVPLMTAAVHGHVGVVELLLSRKEIEIDRQDNIGWTALYLASFNNHSEVIELLLRAGADPRISDNDGDTPLGVARNYSYEECIPLLEVSK